MKRVIFLDRDGTIVLEPHDFQVDSLDKLVFYPKVIRNLYRIKKLGRYELVMVTNQDGLGTPSFPEKTFWPAHNMILKTLEGEGITFDEVLIDPSFPEDNSPNRKPGTGMLKKYMDGSYDLANSYVIGDRMSDAELAENLGAKAIIIGRPKEITANFAFAGDDWDEVAKFIFEEDRRATVIRNTKETRIYVDISLDGCGSAEISTGIGFFNHLLEQLAKHSGINLAVRVNGDLDVDEHHTIEDTALAIGEALRKALGKKWGIERYGFVLPMDDSLCSAAMDLGGRPWIVWEAEFEREMIGSMPTEMFFHFFKSLSDAAHINLNIKAEGDNEHHKIEGIFKAFARCLKAAVRRDMDSDALPTTKGVL